MVIQLSWAINLVGYYTCLLVSFSGALDKQTIKLTNKSVFSLAFEANASSSGGIQTFIDNYNGLIIIMEHKRMRLFGLIISLWCWYDDDCIGHIEERNSNIEKFSWQCKIKSSQSAKSSKFPFYLYLNYLDLFQHNLKFTQSNITKVQMWKNA